MMDALSNIKLVACDMDGTFLSPDHTIRPQNVKAVEALSKFGITFILATGRNRGSAAGVVGKTYNLNRQAGVYLNGATVYNDKGVLSRERNLEENLTRSLLKFVQPLRDKVSLNVVSYDAFYSPDITEPWAKYLHTEYHDPNPQSLIGGYKATELPKVHLLHVCGDATTIDGIIPKVEAICKPFGAMVARNLPTDIAITHPSADKGDALRAICTEMRIDLGHHVLAIGDSENDISMVRAAAVGVAMGNASAALKGSADAVVNSNSSELPGVAQVLAALAAAKGVASPID